MFAVEWIGAVGRWW